MKIRTFSGVLLLASPGPCALASHIASHRDQEASPPIFNQKRTLKVTPSRLTRLLCSCLSQCFPQNPSIDSNGFMKPRVLSPREKYSVIRNIGRGWREANIHLPPYSMVLVEVSTDLQQFKTWPGAWTSNLCIQQIQAL
eukprot:scaffold87062_cov18-Tisochrysis_lutea.AAC.1